MKVEEKIEKMLTDGGAMFVHFNTTNVATKSKEKMTRLEAKTISQKIKDVGVPTDLCWCWFTSGECRLTSCFHKHTDQYRGHGGKSDEVHEDETVAEADGPVSGTKCLNCKEEPQYRENGKVYPASYCGITCAEEKGAALGEPKQNEKLSNNAMIQEEDTTWRGSNFMVMTGISHVEMLEETATLGFMTSKVSAADVVSVYSKEFSDLLQNMGFIATE